MACGRARTPDFRGARSPAFLMSRHLYVVVPGDAHQGDIIGPAWVVFDPRTGSSGKPSQTIYVGVAQPDGPNIFVSTNGGATWSAVVGQPTCSLSGTQSSGSATCTNGASWTVSNNAPGPGFFPDRAVAEVYTTGIALRHLQQRGRTLTMQHPWRRSSNTTPLPSGCVDRHCSRSSHQPQQRLFRLLRPRGRRSIRPPSWCPSNT